MNSLIHVFILLQMLKFVLVFGPNKSIGKYQSVPVREESQDKNSFAMFKD